MSPDFRISKFCGQGYSLGVAQFAVWGKRIIQFKAAECRAETGAYPTQVIKRL
ncbi:MAG: hypothetical protein WCW52_08335 [Elusimicrobiales bacterium]